MQTPDTMNENTTRPLWGHNSYLLEQAVGMIDRLQREAHGDFNYAQAIGPHLRHIVEHYLALVGALDSETGLVDYDGRARAPALQSKPAMTIEALRQLITRMDLLAKADDSTLGLDKSLTTRLQAGPVGQMTFNVPTTLGRELLFLSSHTVHHFALLGHYSKAAGVDLGHDFGKAPATLAFERQLGR